MLYTHTADSMLRKGLEPKDGKAFLKHAMTIEFEGVYYKTYFLFLVYTNVNYGKKYLYIDLKELHRLEPLTATTTQN